MCDPYSGREQTKAKHFILEQYLYALAFKVLSGWDELTYVDGFSGPWESHAKDFSDTSFMIAIHALKRVQQHFREKGENKTIKCFFVEKKPSAYAELKVAVSAFHDPANDFFIWTVGKPFEDAIQEIMGILGRSFVLTFIDPTGWTGYPYDKIAPLLRYESGEVLINMMYDFANRFMSDTRPETESTFDPILGGPGWRNRLDPQLPEGEAKIALFRKELRKAGRFRYVIETSIEKIHADRPHYFLAYGTRSPEGLKTFREVERSALRRHERTRQSARLESKVEKSGQGTLFGVDDFPNSVDGIIEDNKSRAKSELANELRKRRNPLQFQEICLAILEKYMLRETNVKDICVELAREGLIEATWKSDGKQKPHNYHLIKLSSQ